MDSIKGGKKLTKAEMARAAKEKEEAERKAVLDKYLTKAGFAWEYEPSFKRKVKAQLFEDYFLSSTWNSEMMEVNARQIATVCKAVDKVQRKYADFARSPRLVLGDSSDYAFQEGFGDMNVRLPNGITVNVELEDCKLADQIKDASAFSRDINAAIDKVKPKDSALSIFVGRDFYHWFPKRHYKTNANK